MFHFNSSVSFYLKYDHIKRGNTYVCFSFDWKYHTLIAGNVLPRVGFYFTQPSTRHSWMEQQYDMYFVTHFAEVFLFKVCLNYLNVYIIYFIFCASHSFTFHTLIAGNALLCVIRLAYNAVCAWNLPKTRLVLRDKT